MKSADKIWNVRYTACRLRLLDNLVWFPLPFFIPFGLVLFLTVHVLSGSNVRLGHPVEVLTLQSDLVTVPTIWFSVIPRGESLVVTTSERTRFTWNLADPEPARVAAFSKYLRDAGIRQVEDAAIALKARPEALTAYIALDQKLTYHHVVPILSALAEAGIYRYEFETRLPPVNSKHVTTALWQN